MERGEIYLDYAATTPVDPRVIEAMVECLGPGGDSANPSSSHPPGRRARARVEEARAQVARRVGVAPETLRFTSGATESDNLALIGAMDANRHRGRHLITSRLEHKAVLDTAAALQDKGCEVTYVDHGADGVIDPDAVEECIRDDTVLVSIMHVNNETGVVQDIAAIGERCRQRGVLFHVDAAQSTGKVPLQLGDWPVDLASLTAHKTYGPMGIGAIHTRKGVRIVPQIHGGEQEGRLRPGTLATHQIVGFGAAFELADPSDRRRATGRSQRPALERVERHRGCAPERTSHPAIAACAQCHVSRRPGGEPATGCRRGRRFHRFRLQFGRPGPFPRVARDGTQRHFGSGHTALQYRSFHHTCGNRPRGRPHAGGGCPPPGTWLAERRTGPSE